MCFGDSTTSQVTTQVPQPKTAEEQQAIQLALQSLQMRQALMPFVLQQAGIGTRAGTTPGGSELFQLPPTPQQQSLDTLTQTSLGGANQAAQMALQRLGAGQSMIPGLMGSVRASMPPGLQGLAGTGGGAFSVAPPSAGTLPSGPPVTSTRPPLVSPIGSTLPLSATTPTGATAATTATEPTTLLGGLGAGALGALGLTRLLSGGGTPPTGPPTVGANPPLGQIPGLGPTSLPQLPPNIVLPPYGVVPPPTLPYDFGWQSGRLSSRGSLPPFGPGDTGIPTPGQAPLPEILPPDYRIPGITYPAGSPSVSEGPGIGDIPTPPVSEILGLGGAAGGGGIAGMLGQGIGDFGSATGVFGDLGATGAEGLAGLGAGTGAEVATGASGLANFLSGASTSVLPLVGVMMQALAPYLPGGQSEQEYNERVSRTSNAVSVAQQIEKALGMPLGADYSTQSSGDPRFDFGAVTNTGMTRAPQGTLAASYQSGGLNDQQLWQTLINAYPEAGLAGATLPDGSPMPPDRQYLRTPQQQTLFDIYSAIRNTVNPNYQYSGGIDSLFDYATPSQQIGTAWGSPVTLLGSGQSKRPWG